MREAEDVADLVVVEVPEAVDVVLVGVVHHEGGAVLGVGGEHPEGAAMAEALAEASAEEGAVVVAGHETVHVQVRCCTSLFTIISMLSCAPLPPPLANENEWLK